MSILTDFDPDAPGAATGSTSLFGLPHTPETAKIVVIPVPFEATTSYGRGTAKAPERVLEASLQVDLFDAENGETWRDGIAMDPIDPELFELDRDACAAALPIIEAGGVGDNPELLALAAQVDRACESITSRVEKRTSELLAQGRIPVVLGGDHSVPLGAHLAVVKAFPNVGFLHIDAHADLRVAYEGFTYSHASIIHNTLRLSALKRVVQVGIRDYGTREAAYIENDRRIICWPDRDLAWELAGGETWVRICGRIVSDLPDDVWITFDIDGLDPALCPATGTPVPGGLSWNQALGLLDVLVREGKRIVGFDLVEVGDAEWDANVGARMLYKLAGYTLRSQRS